MTQKENKTLIQAIADFQKAAPIILKSATNPFFKSKYADLPAVWHTIHDLMSSNGLAVVNMNVIIDGVEYLETRIYHTSGDYISSTSRLAPVKNDPQSVGSAITYMRRYALMSLLGLVADDDDDGNAASGNNQKQQKQEKPKQEKTKAEIEAELIEKYGEEAIGTSKLIIDAIRSAKDEKVIDTIEKVRKADIDKLPEEVRGWIEKAAQRKRADLSVINAG